MTYNVFGGTLNRTQSINYFKVIYMVNRNTAAEENVCRMAGND